MIGLAIDVNTILTLRKPGMRQWLLATGDWNDTGEWKDTAVWID